MRSCFLISILVSIIFCSCDPVETAKRKNERQIQKYMEKNNINGIATGTGLYYEITRTGDGQTPTILDEVTVDYEGRLKNDDIFDSSYERGAPSTFYLTQVIAGWTEGLQLIERGGAATLLIPSHLGYGKLGSFPNIPGDAVLVFDVELVDF